MMNLSKKKFDDDYFGSLWLFTLFSKTNFHFMTLIDAMYGMFYRVRE